MKTQWFQWGQNWFFFPFKVLFISTSSSTRQKYCYTRTARSTWCNTHL